MNCLRVLQSSHLSRHVGVFRMLKCSVFLIWVLGSALLSQKLMLTGLLQLFSPIIRKSIVSVMPFQIKRNMYILRDTTSLDGESNSGRLNQKDASVDQAAAITRLEFLREQTSRLEKQPRLGVDFLEWYLHALETFDEIFGPGSRARQISSASRLSFPLHGNSREQHDCAKNCECSMVLMCQSPCPFHLRIATRNV